jgi:adenylate cyclase
MGGSLERRTVAILATDVVGFSQLMRQDEEATLAALKELFAVMHQLVEECHGHAFGGAGDSLLAEFSSPVQAVRCAMEIQRRNRQLNALAPKVQLHLRIGVNMGEVIVTENGVLQGNSVNLAVRLEGLADPGGVTMSEIIFRNVKDQIVANFEDRGHHRVRGFPDPIHTYRVRPDDSPSEPSVTSGNVAPLAFGDLSSTLPAADIVSARPIIVVLTFSNLSGDPQQEYFCHGLTNDITTELSKFSSLSVVSYATAFAFRNKNLRIQDVSHELGARYVLEGSIQKTTDRLRINAQLIDAIADRHVWAKRFDREMADVFLLQDEIVQNVVAAMALKVEAEERERAIRKATVNLNAYDAFLKGSHQWLFHSYVDETKQTLLGARHWFEMATSLDPNYGRAWAWLSLTYIQEWIRSWGSRSSLVQGGKFAKKAVMLDSTDYNNRWILAYFYLNARQFDLALREYELAASLNPHDANLLAEFGEAMVYVGEPDKGLELIQQAIKMNPHLSEWYHVDVAWVHYVKRHYRAAITQVAKLALPNADALLILAASHAQVADHCLAEGMEADAILEKKLARKALRRAKIGRPRWTINKERQKSPFKREEDLNHWLNGLIKAGLPQ